MRLAPLLLVSAARLALADPEPVRDDIVELRHDRMPKPHRFLGWTADGRAVIHSGYCSYSDGGGFWQCSSSVVVVNGAGARETVVLQPDCDPCTNDGVMHWKVPTAMASRAIHAERATLDSLGPLTPSAKRVPPAVGVDAKMCRLDLVIGTHRVAVGRLGHQCLADGGDDSYRGGRIVDVQRSPDGRELAVTLVVTMKSMEWSCEVEYFELVPALE